MDRGQGNEACRELAVVMIQCQHYRGWGVGNRLFIFHSRFIAGIYLGWHHDNNLIGKGLLFMGSNCCKLANI